MRKSKYRAWDPEKKEMLYPGHRGFHVIQIKDQLQGFRARREDESPSFPNDDDWDYEVILLQDIERLDKNGRDIYEGDILTDYYGRLLQVIWRNHGFQFKALKETNFLYATNIEEWFAGYCKELPEIVGNIYENTELLPLNLVLETHV